MLAMTLYRDLSADEGFPDELKTSIRFLASVLLRRIKKVQGCQQFTDYEIEYIRKA
jgi:hypothetical protein